MRTIWGIMAMMTLALGPTHVQAIGMPQGIQRVIDNGLQKNVERRLG